MISQGFSWDAVWRIWLCAGLTEGLFVLLMVAWVGSGATALHGSFTEAAALRIGEIVPGGATRGKVLAARAKQTIVASFAPWKAAGTPDIKWARDMTKSADHAMGPEDRHALYELLGEMSGSRDRALAFLHGKEPEWVNHEIVERASLARDITELRSLAREKDRIRVTLLWTAVRDDEASLLWRPLGAKLLDFVGRGTAAGLLLAALIQGDDTATLMNRIAIMTVIGAAFGSLIFVAMAAHTLLRIRAARTGDGKWTAKRHAIGAAAAVPTMITLVFFLQQGVHSLLTTR
ncbi:hypothetical protein [Streptomyces parvus]|uniref:hypothetical protein n=1 Tax=Streptomyces parvus TaxID=66428 RepID=UPI003D72602D